MEASKEHSIAAIVISKSGTTTEPAIAFRLIKAEIEARYRPETVSQAQLDERMDKMFALWNA